MRKIAVFICLCLSGKEAYSQSEAFSPTVIPPATAEIIKFIDHPVDLAYGLASVEIPLYVIKQGDIEIPLSIKYHGAGLKVNELNNRIGSGWSLDFGPSLGRKINNMPDDYCYMRNGGWKKYRDRLTYLRYLAEGVEDEYPDVYYYKLLSNSGKFVFNRGSSSDYKDPVIETIPFEPVKVTTANNNTDLSAFNIWDDKGYFYRFGVSLKGSGIYAYDRNASSFCTSWKIMEVVSPDKADTVSFGYTKEDYNIYLPSIDDYVTVEDIYKATPGYIDMDRAVKYYGIQYLKFPFMTERTGASRVRVSNILEDEKNEVSCYSPPEYATPSANTLSHERYLTSVESRTVRVDIFKAAGSVTNHIEKITVTDKATNKVIKTIEFTHSAFNPPAENPYSKKKLDEIRIYGENHRLDQTYSFDYYNPQGVPAANCRGVDHWGYYTGINPSTAVPLQEIDCLYYHEDGGWAGSDTRHLQIGSAGKSPNDCSQYGLLKSVTFPTGRKSTFHYEQNRRKDYDGAVKLTGGNRIGKIEEFDPVSGATVTRTFKYGLNEDGGGYISREVTLDDYMYEYLNYGYPGDMESYTLADITRIRIYTPTPLNNLFFQNGAVVCYDYVTEYVDGKGKTEYVYDVGGGSSSSRIPGTTLVADIESGWMRGKLLQKTEYKYNPKTSDYCPIRMETNEYAFYKNKSIPFGMCYAAARSRYPDFPDNVLKSEGYVLPGEYGLSYHASYSISTGCNRLTKQTIRTFDENKTSTKSIVYVYGNPDHMYPTRETVQADPHPVVTDYKYPQDLTFADSREEAGRTGLINNNILSTVLLAEKSVSGKTWFTKTKYLNTDSNPIPRAVSISEGPGLNRLRMKQRVDKFDVMGNPVQITDNEKTSVYLWGYGGRRLIAEIRNATYAEVSASLGQPVINRMLTGLFPGVSDLLSLNDLRTRLPDALVTTLEYKPSVGISRITDPRGKCTNYEYDHAGRLSKVLDHENNILEEYQYNYCQ